MELIDILKGVELFRGLSVEQLQRLVDISHKEVYHADQVVFDQGAAGEKMYVITQGEVEVRVKGGTGSKQTMVYLGRGQLFGEMALLDQSERSATVVAAQDNTVLYAVASNDFLHLCTSDTGAGYIMMRNLAMDLSFKLRRQNLDTTSGL
ncbi:MAG TPA: cyclic nucleotide-binding domain-containing protein [Phototrophicaceae bacterium]|nr:cyclic nucleotide-binding domain-containing protein [Phototrophicaceae bacterium]